MSLKNYVCECCGGRINLQTMQCEYCGTQYKKENEEVFRIETFPARVQQFKSAYSITDDYLMRYPKEASEMAIHQVADQLAQIIAPYCEYHVGDDPMRRVKIITARIKIVEPINKGLRIEDYI